MPVMQPQKRSRLQVWTVDEEELMMTHELSPKVVAAYQLVSNPPERLDTTVRCSLISLTCRAAVVGLQFLSYAAQYAL